MQPPIPLPTVFSHLSTKKNTNQNISRAKDNSTLSQLSLTSYEKPKGNTTYFGRFLLEIGLY